ncbi:MAG TPA: hypothetical protein VJ969_04910, partial [Desulfopila sp.]|nr:hypothetical protein [Desulfopila sp.]
MTQSPQFRSLSNFSVRSIGIITKRADKPAADFAEELEAWLKKRQVSVDLNTIHPQQNILVVLGG